jgi:hypothetical protein
MTVFIALAIIANTYFIQPDYFDHRDTVGITVVSECRSVVPVKTALLEGEKHGLDITSAHCRKAFGNSITCKRPRDWLIYTHMLRDKTA